MMRFSRWPSISGITATVIVVSGCVSEATDIESRQFTVMSSAATEESPVKLLIERQRDFMEAMTGGDPTPFMSTGFDLVDWTDRATPPSIGLGPRVASGPDYLSTLAERLPDEFSQLAVIEAHLPRSDQGVVIAKHLSGANSITHWSRTDAGWKAAILILDVPDSIVSRARQHYVNQL